MGDVVFISWAVAVFASGALANVSVGPASVRGPSGATVNMGALVLCAIMCAYYILCWHDAQVARAREAKEVEDASAPAKKPRIGALDSLRFILIAYIASGHFIHTATQNPFLLRFISQINVVVGAFFVISGYVAAYTTTELGQRKGSKRLDNAVEFVITRIMGHWPLHLMVLLLFSPVFLFVDLSYSGVATAAWNGFISIFMLQAWFPTSAEVWNAPTWFLSALSFALCALPYGLRILAGHAGLKKEELRRTLVILTVLSLVPKVAYSNDLHAWGIMEGMLNAKTHPNYALFNSIRFSPLGALLEVHSRRPPVVFERIQDFRVRLQALHLGVQEEMQGSGEGCRVVGLQEFFAGVGRDPTQSPQEVSPVTASNARMRPQ
ncbi:unnamed protein product [Symbiodinium natans]|uniref:Acyltransferase 3 domain-containing protein n=1 Tax=Symbiodinium natans TaxID=878477 RepID=A0A812R3S4_9DINO|nr:unnamed protein product [Symbiodinium natans]